MRTDNDILGFYSIEQSTTKFVSDEHTVVTFDCKISTDSTNAADWKKALDITEQLSTNLQKVISDKENVSIVITGEIEEDNPFIEALCDRLWSLFYTFKDAGKHHNIWIYICTDDVHYAISGLVMHHMSYIGKNLHVAVGKDIQLPKKIYKKIGPRMIKDITEEFISID
jgi:hypothetical protein